MRCVVGGQLPPELLQTGHEVRAVARTPDELAELPWRDAIEVVQGDVTDPRGCWPQLRLLRPARPRRLSARPVHADLLRRPHHVHRSGERADVARAEPHLHGEILDATDVEAQGRRIFGCLLAS